MSVTKIPINFDLYYLYYMNFMKKLFDDDTPMLSIDEVEKVFLDIGFRFIMY